MIYITGCAKSGTTMLNNLMTAFDAKVAPAEITLWDFYNADFDIGKRVQWTIFSNKMNYFHLYRQYMFIKNQGIQILNITRNKEDVLRSENGYVSEARYDACQDQLEVFGDIVTLNVTFEEILLDPTGMQYTIAMYFDLEAVHRWEDYPDFVPQEIWDMWEHAGPRYGPRKLGEKK